ncbi:MAG: I78 family peptidase inhibitor [Pseudomonadota bacterium]
MIAKPLFLLAPIAILAAGAGLGVAANAQPTRPAPPPCKTEPGQAFVGGPATQESGVAIMKATGATIFQWVFEGSAVTMDYRENRVRVVYNRAMKVVAVTCG